MFITNVKYISHRDSLTSNCDCYFDKITGYGVGQLLTISDACFSMVVDQNHSHVSKLSFQSFSFKCVLFKIFHSMSVIYNFSAFQNKEQRRIQDRGAGRAPPPLVLKKITVFFL